jgi:hypothetical protein
MKKTIFLSVLSCLLLSLAVNAQPIEEPCGYVPDPQYLSIWKNPNSLQRKRVDFLKKYPLKEVFQLQSIEYKQGKFQIPASSKILKELPEEDLFASVKVIPIVAHIVRRTNGSGGLTEAQLGNAITAVNGFYDDFHFRFIVCEIRYIDSDAIFNHTFSHLAETNGNPSSSFNTLSVTTRNVSRYLNMYFVPNSSTSWTWRPLADARRQHILMLNSQTTNGVTPSHEIGHWLDLFHTHGSGDFTDELVNGSNCSTAGDFVCDTPADPNLSGVVNSSCVYTGTSVDANNQAFRPDTRNILSYSINTCRNRFTDDQIYRMQSAFLGMQEDRGYTLTTCAYAQATINSLCYNAGGWRVEKNPRLLGDVNGDGKKDIVGFGNDRVFVALGQSDGTFSNPIGTVPNYGYNAGGWRVEKNPRLLGDVNGDGKEDIVGFGNERVFVSLGRADGTFANPVGTVANYGYNAGGWRVDKNPRLLGDVNGDGRADIIGFGNERVFVSLGRADGTFANPVGTVANYGYNAGGWRVNKNPRLIGDVNGDGRADIVGFGNERVFVSLGQADGTFSNPAGTVANYGYNAGGWRTDRHPRMLADVNGDDRVDIVGFGGDRVFVSLGQTNGTFANPVGTVGNLGYNAGGWRVDRHPRLLGDINNDNRADIVAFGNDFVFVALGRSNGTFSDITATLNTLCYNAGGWRVERHPRMLGDTNGDGKADIIGFGNTHVYFVDGNNLD